MNVLQAPAARVKALKMRRRALSTFRRLPAGEQQVENTLLAPALALHLIIWCCHLTVCIIVSQPQASVHICRGVLLRVTLLASGFLIGMPPQMLSCVKQLFRQAGELELRLASCLMSGTETDYGLCRAFWIHCSGDHSADRR